MSSKSDCPENCFQGSTEFYDTPDTDDYTPSPLEAQLLVDNVGRRRDCTIPEWIDVAESSKSPAEQYVEWFNGIWHTGDPSGWGPEVFTNQAVMMDPSGISKGAKQAADSFTLIFKYFPELRGEVVSWAANDREILINWRFKIQRAGRTTLFLVPVVDKFCFVDGRVSFRLATFDLITFVGYLSENYGQDQLFEFLWAYFWQAGKTGGIVLLPRMLLNFVKGGFLWRQPPESTLSLKPTPDERIVRLKWEPMKDPRTNEDVASYRVCRATDIAGPYLPLPVNKKLEVQKIHALTYDDKLIANGPQQASAEAQSKTEGQLPAWWRKIAKYFEWPRITPYWYLVSPSFEKWVPVKKYGPHADPCDRRVRGQSDILYVSSR